MAYNTSRITEADLVRPALEAAEGRTNGFISTSDLIDELTQKFQPTGEDAQILGDRSDTYFSQKVRNLISHRNEPHSFIHNGLAEYDPVNQGIKITDAGRKFLGVTGT